MPLTSTVICIAPAGAGPGSTFSGRFPQPADQNTTDANAPATAVRMTPPVTV